MPLLMGTIMLRAAIQTGMTCDEANGHDVWQSPVQTATFRFKARLPGPNGHAATFPTINPRAPVQTVTACGKARFKRSRLGPKRDA